MSGQMVLFDTDRTSAIKSKGYQPYYEEFLIQNPDEPSVDDIGWISMVPFMIWIQGKHSEYRKIHGYSRDYPSLLYAKDFTVWLRSGSGAI